MKKVLATIAATVLLIAVSFSVFAQANVSKKPAYTVVWSHYITWELVQFLKDSGILKKWADKGGITINVKAPMDYMDSVNAFNLAKVEGEADAIVVANVEALGVIASNGTDATVLIVQDYSNGNDGVVIRNGKTCADTKGREIKLVEQSVSHYLLSRMLSTCGVSEKNIIVKNTTDSDIAAAFIKDRSPKAAVVAWNPQLMDIRNAKGATMVFDSSKIPGEILDLMVVKTNAPESLKKALVGAWFEATATLGKGGPARSKLIDAMAKSAENTVAQIEAQLKTTALFGNPSESVAFAEGEQIKKSMGLVSTFAFEHGMYPPAARSKDYIGVQFPDGSVMGNKANVRLRFDTKYVRALAQ